LRRIGLQSKSTCRDFIDEGARKTGAYKVARKLGLPILPIALGLSLSGCVSTDTALNSSLGTLNNPSDIALDASNPNIAGADQANLINAAEEGAVDGAIPVPSSIKTAFNATEASNQNLAVTPQTLSGGIGSGSRALANDGQLTSTQTPPSASAFSTNAPANTPSASGNNNLLLASAKPATTAEAGLEGSSLAKSANMRGSFFSQLFKKTPKAKSATAEPVVARAQVNAKPTTAAIQAPASKLVQANVEPLPGVKTKTRNVFSTIFGKKEGTSEDGLAEKRVQVASAAGLARLSPLTLQRQTERVDVACFKPELVRRLKQIESYYKRPVVVTSGYRSPKHNKKIGGASGSRHTTCEAADVQVKGVSKWDLAKYVRSMPGRGGVGTYCHTQSVHIDIGTERDWNWRCRKRRK
jgi:uncharacterized protein YcbK (DUF882 family)